MLFYNSSNLINAPESFHSACLLRSHLVARSALQSRGTLQDPAPRGERVLTVGIYFFTDWLQTLIYMGIYEDYISLQNNEDYFSLENINQIDKNLI